MKINKLKLKNFKIFKDCEFNFKKITLLTGTNSAGKSTVLNAIASILQSESNVPFPFKFYSFGVNVHLGGYQDIVHKGNTSEKIHVEIEYELDESNKKTILGVYRYDNSISGAALDELSFDAGMGNIKIKWNSTTLNYEAFRTINSERIHSDVLNILLSTDLSKLESAHSSTNKKTTNKKNNPKLEQNRFRELFNILTNDSKDWEKLQAENYIELISEIQKDPLYSNFLDSIRRELEIIRNSATYIGPIRNSPERHYYLQTNENKISPLGSNSYQLLAEWLKSNINKFNSVLDKLKQLELADNLHANTIKENLIEFTIKPFGHSEEVNISDVGFGLSQILPILVADVDIVQNGLMLINQPEVHLHPSSQASLANYFVGSSDRNYIVETHSEFIINRLRLLVANKEVNKDDIAIIFIDNENGETKIHNIKIDAYGKLSGAPESFFNTYYVDNTDLLLSNFVK